MVNELNNAQSGTVAIIPSISKDSGQIDGQSYRYRPNNSFVKIRIVFWHPDFHLPVTKRTGKNTIKEYMYWQNATFERALGSRWLIAHIKKRRTWLVDEAGAVDDANREYTDMAMRVVKLFEEMNKDKVKLDYTNFKHQIKEFEIKHKKIDLPRDLRFKDTVGKKVYSTGIEYYSPIAVKNTINNLAMRDELPEIKQLLSDFSKQLSLHLSAVQELKDAAKELKESVKRETIWQKIRRWVVWKK